MNRKASCLLIAVTALGLGLLVPSAPASAADVGVDPTDSRLIPQPIENSDPGTSWTCMSVGSEVQCAGDLAYSWVAEPGPDDWCTQPLWSVNGQFSRSQTRYYSLDTATGYLLEYKRLVHLDGSDTLVATPDASPSGGVQTRGLMTWRSDFGVPGDLDSRVTRKQGIDTMFKLPQGGVFTMDVGQKKTILGDDFAFHGRWDIALGDPPTEFGKVCTALGLG